MPNSDTDRSVVVTGASTGIGRACALHIDRLGWRVFAGVRKESDAASLRAEASARLIPVLLDVTEAASIQSASQVVSSALGEAGLSGLVNNAGIPYGGPVEYLDLDEVRRLFEVNFFGVIAVTQALLPLLRKCRGRIVNMSSISGMVASPFVSPYSCSKFALEALTDSLRVELRPWHIQVSSVQPGAIETPIWDKAGSVLDDIVGTAPRAALDLYGGAIRGMRPTFETHGISTAEVSEAVAHALTSAHPKTRYRIGVEGAVVRLFRWLPDRLRDRILASRLPKWGAM
ncbi:MAG TPA: SDR family oxidoreductase [Anaerolineales bacterium]|nr:SDR family oxidoreductase [Anaerolineales bacterium]